MIIPGLFIAIIIILILIYFYVKKTKNYPPGPFGWPVFGNIFLIRRLARRLGGQHLAFLELSRQYVSDIVALRFGGTNIMVVCSQKGIKQMLHSEAFDGRPWNEFTKLRNFGIKNGITMADGAEWREMRSWLMRKLRLIGLGRKDMSDLMVDELKEILSTVKGGGVYRLKPVIAPAVINVLWTLATGKRLCNEQKLQYFINLMERRAQAFDMSGGLLSALPWIRYIIPEASGYNLLVTLSDELKGFLMDTINEHKQNYTTDMQGDLIDMFLTEMYSENGSKNFTDDQLVMVLADLFIAGSNTTATTLDFLFLNMVVNPDVQKRLHEEIDEVIGNRTPDLNDRPRLPYAEAVLAESQRMCLITPVVGPRRVLKETNLLGYTIPKGATTLANIWSIHMNPDLFPEPETFKPERFLKNGVYVPNENLIFFGEGKRRCAGETLARCALLLLFVGVMQEYQLLPVPGQEPPTLIFVPGLTISPKPYEVLLTPRQTKP